MQANKNFRKQHLSLRPQPKTRQPSATNKRTKKCYICQKYVLAQKYSEHLKGCHRFTNQTQKDKFGSLNQQQHSKITNKQAKQKLIQTQSIKNNTNTSNYLKNHSLGPKKVEATTKNTTSIVNTHNKNIRKNIISNPINISNNNHSSLVNPNIANRKYTKKQSINKVQNKPMQTKNNQNQKKQQIFVKKEQQNPEIIQNKFEQKRQRSTKKFRVHQQQRPPSAKNSNHMVGRQKYEEEMQQFDHLQAIPVNGTGNRYRPGRFLLSQQSEYQSQQLLSSFQSGQQISAMNRLKNFKEIDEQQRKRIKDEVLEEIARQRKRDCEADQQLQNQRQKQLARQREMQRQIQMKRQQERKRVLQEQRKKQQQRRRQRQLYEQRQRLRQIQRQRQLERQREIQRQRQLERQRQRQLERQRQQQRNIQQQQSNQNAFEPLNQNLSNAQRTQQFTQIIDNNTIVINFVQNTGINEPALNIMLEQLQQLNRILNQIRELNTLGTALGFTMGATFVERIQNTQIVLINQISVLILNNFNNQVHQSFASLLNQRIPSIKKGFTEDEIARIFPNKLNPVQNQCSICLEDIKIHTFVKQLQCKHVFHPQCIDSWLKQSVKCPMCRQEQVSN